MLINELTLCTNYLLDDLTKVTGDAPKAEPKLVLLAQAFAKIFRGKTREERKLNASLYKVFISEGRVRESNKKHISYHGSSPAAGHNSCKVLNYWCFCTGLAIEEIKRLGVRSIILTSGTLSPMDSFKEDLRVPFPIELENPHVIDEKKQIWVGALSAGPTGKELNTSYSKRDLSYSKDELGNTILMICQTMVGLRSLTGSSTIPAGPELKGGVLIFFPSYGALESSRKHWTDSGLWAKLKSLMVNIVVEAKSGSAVPSANRNSRVDDKAFGFMDESSTNMNSGHNSAAESTIAEFERSLQSTGKSNLTVMLLLIDLILHSYRWKMYSYGGLSW